MATHTHTHTHTHKIIRLACSWPNPQGSTLPYPPCSLLPHPPLSLPRSSSSLPNPKFSFISAFICYTSHLLCQVSVKIPSRTRLFRSHRSHNGNTRRKLIIEWLIGVHPRFANAIRTSGKDRHKHSHPHPSLSPPEVSWRPTNIIWTTLLHIIFYNCSQHITLE